MRSALAHRERLRLECRLEDAVEAIEDEIVLGVED